MEEKDSWLNGLSAVTLKSLLENPNMLMPTSMMRNAAKYSGDEYSSYQEKQKIVEHGPDDFGNPMSAFLGPKLWENTLPDHNDLKFEYMDIEEFLSEHGLPSEDVSQCQPNTQKADMVAQTPSPHSQAQLTPLPPTPQTHTTLMPVRREDPCRKQEDGPARMQTSCSHDLREIKEIDSKPVLPLPPGPQLAHSSPSSPTQETPQSPLSIPTPPREPSPVQVDIPFDLSSTDVALATVPGECVFNPREKKFSEEELKPQPMIKKSRKIFVPSEQKDDKYWERRRKNNVAAKRSRDARRVKENQIVLRASFLEKENNALKDEVLGLKKDNLGLKKLVANLEKQLRAAQGK
ncbi:thyrotroph embryonic factor-like [Amphiura filiformis]|uniref:thyrotroph embryonic factor-like n=1 Tax=Amphiura filiformis TaxID=82378 RepID=UPI003B21FCFB